MYCNCNQVTLINLLKSFQLQHILLYMTPTCASISHAAALCQTPVTPPLVGSSQVDWLMQPSKAYQIIEPSGIE